MKNKLLLLFIIICTCLSANAQIKIDFDYIKDNNRKTKDGFTSWNIDKDTKSMTINGVTFNVSGTGGTLNCNWYNVKIANELQIMDGLHNKDASGATSITIKIEGLAEGTHTVQAYHNNVDGVTTTKDVNISVNGTYVTKVAQTIREESISEAARSNITFSGTSATIKYYSDGDFYINSFEIDVNNADYMVQNPYPANLDYHVDADDGSVTLSWTPAVNTPTSHIFYFGESEEEVENATSGGTSTTNTSVTKSGLTPLKRYYWRVDEVIDDMTYKGDVMSFQPRRLAFPGADGAGKYAVGGRGWDGNGIVYRVTSLEDNVDNPTEGTLRYGVEKLTGPRTIVFDVAGVITLTDRLNASDSYITVAGQTAPGIGVLLRDNTYGANGPDNITRFMNFRYGHGDDWKETSANQNVGGSAGMAGADNAIMDHCTLAWGNDEVFSSRNANDMTLQNCLIGEALNQNGHKNYWDDDHDCQHGYAASIGGSVGSFHHNLLAHNAGRNWSMAGGLLGGAYAGKLSIYNNVVYNWHNRTTDGGAHNVNFVNNYYKKGVASDNSKFMLSAQLEGSGTGTQEYYVNGNVLELTDGNKIQDKENTTYKWENKGQDATWDVFVDQPYDFWSMEINVETAEAAFKNVLCDVGANFAGQDTNSKRLIQETKDGTWSKTGSRSGMEGLIDKEADSEGWEKIEKDFGYHTRPENWDADADGIPAWFETAKGWNDAAANNNADSDGDYYTDLEEYLNWMAVPHFYKTADDGTVTALETATNHTITLADYFAGYTSPTYTVVSNGGATATISNGVLTYNFPANASKLATIQVKATQDGISLTRSFNFFIDGSNIDEPETPVVTPEGTAYTLAVSTNTKNNTTSSYEFKSEGVTFTVTNTNGKGYGEGNEDGVKYSAGVQYTINIPEGYSVNGIKFSGYDNYADADAYLGELNGTEYTESNYVFPKKDSNSNYTVKDYTISFDTPVTNTLTFTPKGKQVVWAITIYATFSYGLEEIENTMEEVADGTETVIETGTITWVFNEGNGDKKATYSDGIKDYVGSASVTLGDKLEYNGTKDVNGITETLVRPTEQTNEVSDENAVTFSFTTKDKTTFTPTNVSYYISKIGTDNGTYSAKMNNNVSTSTIVIEEKPNRNNESNGWYTRKDNETVNMSAAQTNSLVFNLWGLQTGKDFGLANVVITGDLIYQRQTTITIVTLDEMATVHDLEAEDNVTVKMKRGLTKGIWNTLCVPFDLTKTELQTALSDNNVEIVEYTRQEGTMLYFEDTEYIEAGKPYLIKPSTFSSTYDNMTPIIFEGVNLIKANVTSNGGEVAKTVTPTGADFSFVGTYVRYIMQTDGTQFGMNTKNKLAKPAAAPKNVMRGLRAFFKTDGEGSANTRVVIGGELTSIDEIDGGTASAKGVYHVSGRYVRSEWNNGSGLPRGLYIVNGQKMVK